MTEPRREKVSEKYAWVILAAIGVLTLVGGLPHALGFNTDPGTAEKIAGVSLAELEASNPRFHDLYDFYFRFGGLSDVAWAVLLIVISATKYRQGEKWAWYALWFLPILFLGSAGIVVSLGPPSTDILPFITLFGLLSLLGLLLPYRKFFPKEP
jgi:hypothetical protein